MDSDEQVAPELLPCPFCGAYADLKSIGEGAEEWLAGCGCNHRRAQTREAAIKLWNTRAALAKQGSPPADAISREQAVRGIRAIKTVYQVEDFAKDKDPREIRDEAEDVIQRLPSLSSPPADTVERAKQLTVEWADFYGVKLSELGSAATSGLFSRFSAVLVEKDAEIAERDEEIQHLKEFRRLTTGLG